MEKINTRKPHNRQKKYRQSQDIKGLVRFEIQLPKDVKQRFDELVEVVADEYPAPWDKRRRISKARVRVFSEITQGVSHEFFNLKDRILALKEEIKALSPNFFKTKIEKTPLPEAISALPDQPKQLKQLLASLYRGLQAAKLSAVEHKRRADQFEKLYNVSSDYNDQLKEEINLKEE
jgi:hypothetical protein